MMDTSSSTDLSSSISSELGAPVDERHIFSFKPQGFVMTVTEIGETHMLIRQLAIHANVYAIHLGDHITR